MENLLLASFIGALDNIIFFLNSSLGIWYDIILNAFGVIAICFKVIEYQSKRRRLIFLLASLSQLLWILYFVWSGDFISAISCIIAVTSVRIFSKKDTCAWARSIWWCVLFIAIQVVLSIFTFKTWKDIFPLIAGILCVFAYSSVNLTKYRVISLFYALAWLLNSILKGYFIALLSDSFSAVSVSIGIFRYDIRDRLLAKKNKNKNLPQKTDDIKIDSNNT